MSHVSIFWKREKQIRNVVLNCCSCGLGWLCLFHDFLCIAYIRFKGKASKNQRSRLSIYIYILSCIHTYGLGIINPCKILVVWLLVFMCMTNRVEGAYEVVASQRHTMKRRRSILKFENICAFESFRTGLAEGIFGRSWLKLLL